MKNKGEWPEASTVQKVVFFVAAACAVMFLGFVIWLAWMFKAAELTANCDDGFTVWRRNSGAFSSYVYEIRDGTKLIEKGLSFSQLKESLDNSGRRCTFLGGG